MGAFTALKEECCAANILLAKHKLIDLTFGNVSILDSDKGCFAIKPSGIDYQSINPEKIVVMDFEGRCVEGDLKPSSDEPTHRRLFQAFSAKHKDIRSIVHTHSRNAVAFAQAGVAIPCLGTTHADYFYGDVPVTRPMTSREITENYEWETGNVIVECFNNLDPSKVSAVLVHAHGPFAWGNSGVKAVENALILEIIAEMALKTIQLNPAKYGQSISQVLLDKHYLRKHGSQAYYGQKA